MKPRDAAKLLNISYPTLKQWIYHDKIRSVKTLGGHHRIPLSEVERLTDLPPLAKNRNMIEMEAISTRNKMPGLITDIHLEGLFAQIKVEIGEHEVMAIIPRQACQDMELKKGEEIVILFKAIDVMVVRG